MMTHSHEGNVSNNPQLSRIMAVADVGHQTEFIENYSSFTSFQMLNQLLDQYRQNTDGSRLAVNEGTALVTLARNASALIPRAQAFLDQSNELVQLARQTNSDGIEKAYAALLASEQYSPLFKKSLREYVEKSGGIIKFVEGSASRAKAVLTRAGERLHRELPKIEPGQDSNRAAPFETGTSNAVSNDSLFEGGVVGRERAPRDAVSNDSLLEGGIAAVGIGLAAVAVGVTAPAWVAAGMVFAGGAMIGFGASCVMSAFERPDKPSLQ